MKTLKFYPVSETHGYAVERQGERYLAAYVQHKMVNGERLVTLESYVRLKGILQMYTSPFAADFVLRKLVLPLYDRSKYSTTLLDLPVVK